MTPAKQNFTNIRQPKQEALMSSRKGSPKLMFMLLPEIPR